MMGDVKSPPARPTPLSAAAGLQLRGTHPTLFWHGRRHAQRTSLAGRIGGLAAEQTGRAPGHMSEAERSAEAVVMHDDDVVSSSAGGARLRDEARRTPSSSNLLVG